MNDEINKSYIKVDSIFKLKLKAQIKGSGLFFKDFLYIKDLVQENSYYFLHINNSVVRFNSLKELYTELDKVISKETKSIQDEVTDYQRHLLNDLRCDKSYILSEMDGLGYREHKLHKLKLQIEKNIEKLHIEENER